MTLDGARAAQSTFTSQNAYSPVGGDDVKSRDYMPGIIALILTVGAIVGSVFLARHLSNSSPTAEIATGLGTGVVVGVFLGYKAKKIMDARGKVSRVKHVAQAALLKPSPDVEVLVNKLKGCKTPQQLEIALNVEKGSGNLLEKLSGAQVLDILKSFKNNRTSKVKMLLQSLPLKTLCALHDLWSTDVFPYRPEIQKAIALQRTSPEIFSHPTIIVKAPSSPSKSSDVNKFAKRIFQDRVAAQAMDRVQDSSDNSVITVSVSTKISTPKQVSRVSKLGKATLVDRGQNREAVKNFINHLRGKCYSAETMAQNCAYERLNDFAGEKNLLKELTPSDVLFILEDKSEKVAESLFGFLSKGMLLKLQGILQNPSEKEKAYCEMIKKEFSKEDREMAEDTFF